eukprot:TRINITY_DN7747_c0_g1_i1.p1 TRINITY_DN7747_c0_g1~~TRINITY_DN7747_c0_g1_i1.p1  ORF type:complete len:362 (+),score=70.72 TRINITY_DN7747_c0_g1_i1:52-1137(+)
MYNPEGRVVEFAKEKRYSRLTKIVGSGGSKVVYEAIDRYRGIEVAWNEVQLNKFSKDRLSKLKNEVHYLSGLAHKNIINFYGSWVDYNPANTRLVFITELMTSGCLTEFLQKSGTVPKRVIQNWGRQILKGLRYLHTQSPPLIHRDIKPDNIFFSGVSGRVKIGDLGLATDVNSKKTNMTVIGTLRYMAPEYFADKPIYNSSVDIWAYGITIIEICTLSLPYSEYQGCGAAIAAISEGKLPKDLAKIIDNDVIAFIGNCLLDRSSASLLLDHEFLDKRSIDETTNSIGLRNQQELTDVLKVIGDNWENYMLSKMDQYPLSFQLSHSQDYTETSSSEESEEFIYGLEYDPSDFIMQFVPPET